MMGYGEFFVGLLALCAAYMLIYATICLAVKSVGWVKNLFWQFTKRGHQISQIGEDKKGERNE